MNQTVQPQSALRRHGWAWLALCGALAVHVTDEASTHFLEFYNPLVISLRQRLGWWPMPTFTFGVWLSGLIAAVVVLALLSVFVFRGARPMIWFSYFFGVVMLLNGLAHSLGSIYFGRLLPGVYSSPLLLAGSVWLLMATRRRQMAS